MFNSDRQFSTLFLKHKSAIFNENLDISFILDDTMLARLYFVNRTFRSLMEGYLILCPPAVPPMEGYLILCPPAVPPMNE